MVPAGGLLCQGVWVQRCDSLGFIRTGGQGVAPSGSKGCLLPTWIPAAGCRRTWDILCASWNGFTGFRSLLLQQNGTFPAKCSTKTTSWCLGMLGSCPVSSRTGLVHFQYAPALRHSHLNLWGTLTPVTLLRIIVKSWNQVILLIIFFLNPSPEYQHHCTWRTDW